MTTWRILSVIPPTFDRWAEFDVRDRLHTMALRALVPAELSLGYRQKIKRRPIAPGYVFAEFPDDVYPAIRLIPGVRGVIGFGGQWGGISQRQVDALELLSTGLETARKISGYKLGQRVAIKRGAMAELHGLIAEIDAKGRVHADIDLFGKVSRVRVSESDVEAA